MEGTWNASHTTQINIDNGSECYVSSKSSIRKTISHNGGGVENIDIDVTRILDEYLKNSNFIGFLKYISESNIVINPNQCWIYENESYPKLYWED